MTIGENFQNPQTAGAVPESGDTTLPDDVNPGASEEQEDTEPKVFTQDQVNAMIGERLAKDRRTRAKEEADRAAQPVAPPAEPPKPADFKTAQEYFDAASTWKADHISYDRAMQQQAQQAASSFEDRTEKARTKYADIDIIFKGPNEGGPAIHPSMKSVIQKSDLGPDVAYHLAKNPELARTIYHMDPIDQAREIGKIEEKLTSKQVQVKQPSSAPEPIEPLSAKGAPASYNTGDPRSLKKGKESDWIAQRNRELAKKPR